MNNVINLNEYKKQKEEEELDDLEAAVSKIVQSLKDNDFQLEPSSFGIPVPHGMFTSYNLPEDIRSHDLNSCVDLLACVGNLLLEHGELELSNKVDNLAVRVQSALAKGP